MEIKVEGTEGKESSRWDYIDLLEALCMLMVIIYHSATYDLGLSIIE